MNRKFGYIRVFLVAVAGLVALFVLFAWWILSDICQNEIKKKFPIVSSNKEVVLFERDCGATTDFSTQISILDNNEALSNSSANIFIADSNHGKALTTKDGLIKVKVVIVSNKIIKILYDKRARVFKKKTSHHGITIEYEYF